MHRYASLAISRASGLMMLLGHVLLFLAEVVAVALLDISLSLYGVALHLQVFYAKRTFITEPAVPIILARIRTAILSKFHMPLVQRLLQHWYGRRDELLEETLAEEDIEDAEQPSSFGTNAAGRAAEDPNRVVDAGAVRDGLNASGSRDRSGFQPVRDIPSLSGARHPTPPTSSSSHAGIGMRGLRASSQPASISYAPHPAPIAPQDGLSISTGPSRGLAAMRAASLPLEPRPQVRPSTSISAPPAPRSAVPLFPPHYVNAVRILQDSPLLARWRYTHRIRGHDEVTAWYVSQGAQRTAPVVSAADAELGDLHINVISDQRLPQIWLRTASEAWVEIAEGHPHLSLEGYVLHVLDSFEPRWVKESTYRADMSRRARQIRLGLRPLHIGSFAPSASSSA